MSGAVERGWAVAPVAGYRIGTAEREHVRDLLERHTAEGRLSLDEFGERIDEVLRARTAVDLEHALRELPPAPVNPGRVPWGVPQPVRGPVALARLVPPVLPVLAVGLFVVVVLSLIGAFWPVWILLLVARFAFFGGRGRRGWDRGLRGGSPWPGTYPGESRAGWSAPDGTSQTRWV